MISKQAYPSPLQSKTPDSQTKPMLSQQFLPSSTLSLSSLSLTSPTPTHHHHPSWAPPRHPLPPVRMGGGPRTFPGGVSKWQWKRMQAKKSKQLLKARLLRERQIYEMRKRAELKAALSELEKPWELVEKAPTLFSVKADEQVKVLADRFQKPGGFDMWSERDGPQVLGSGVDMLPSERFFPKGVVHSVRPYGIVDEDSDGDGDGEVGFDDWIARGGGGVSRRRRRGRRQGVQLNADEKGDGNLNCVDVEAISVDEEGQLGLKNSEGNGKSVGRRRQRGCKNKFNGEKITLRPTSEFNAVEDRKRASDSKWRN